MGIRIDAASEYLNRASALSLVSFTAMGWSQVVTDRGSGTTQNIFMATSAFATDAQCYFNWNNAGDAAMAAGSYSSADDHHVFGSRPAVGDWFHWYAKCSGTGATAMEFGWRRLQDSAYVTVQAQLQGASSTVGFRIGDDGFGGGWGNARHAAFKLYNTALAAGDIERERLTFMPRNTTNLTLWVPMVHASVTDCVRDFSGAGANLTATGTLTVEGGPPINFSGGRRLRIIPVATTNNKTIAADGGSYAITGATVATKLGRKVAANGGSYAITGSAVTLRRNLPLVASGGSYSLSGSAVTTRKTWLLGATGGSYAITGAAVTLKHGYSVGAAGSSYAITGAAVTLKHGYAVSVSAGTYSFTGAAVTLRKASRLDATGGSYAITGAAVTLTKTSAGAFSVAANGGSYAITGATASLVHKWIAGASGGSYAITGATATLRHGWKVAADGGSYAVTGSDVGLVYHGALKVDVGAGSYAITGSAANLTFTPIPPPLPDRVGGRYHWEEHRHKIGDERKKKRIQKAIEEAEEAIAEVDAEDLETQIAALDDKIEALLDARTKAEITASLKAVEKSTAALLRKKAEDDAEEEEAILLLFA